MRVRSAGALLGLVFAGACGNPRGGAQPVVVFAAASLMEAFSGLEQAYEPRVSDRDVRLSFAGSHVLRMQVEQGAQVDLLATADLRHLDSLQTRGLVSPPVPFAVNRLAVVVNEEGLEHIQNLEDLLVLDRIVLGSAEVPVGQYARQMLSLCGDELASGVMGRVVSFEDSARLVRAKVELGEAQAAVIYQSDLVGSRGIREIRIPEHCRVSPVYGISLAQTAKTEAAEDFLALLRSDVGLEILRGHGFEEVQ